MNKEILWNIVNSLLAGALVFLGGCAAGDLNTKVIIASAVAAGLAAIVQFKKFWENEQNEYKEDVKKVNTTLFSFF